jgi:hypothetical protein
MDVPSKQALSSVGLTVLVERWLMPELSPMRGEIGVIYDAAFLYLSVRGIVAERWGHASGFGRHSIGHDNLSLTDKDNTRLAQVNLKGSLFIESAPALDWSKFATDASDFLTDCLKTVQPSAVSAIYADMKLYSGTSTFSSARDRIASALLDGRYTHSPTAQGIFDDLSVSLQFQQGLMTIITTLGPMRRGELGQQVQGQQDLEQYPENVLFVQRRVEAFAGSDRVKDRFGWEKAQERLQSLVDDHVVNATADVSEYVDTILGQS